MSLLRSLLFTAPLIIVSTILMGTLSLLVGFFDRTGNSQHKIARVWARSLLAASLIRVRVTGLEKLDPEGVWASVCASRPRCASHGATDTFGID